MSHSWQTHNYSISSTINGNALKLYGEIKQTPSPHSYKPSASTLPPSDSLHPFTSQSSPRSFLPEALFNHRFIPPSLRRLQIYICCTFLISCPRGEGASNSGAASGVCVYVFASAKGSWIGSRQGALLCVLDSEVLGAAAAYTLMGCRGNNMFVLEGTCVWMDSICHGPSSQEDCVCVAA